MSYVSTLFIRKKTIDSKEGGKRRSMLVIQEASKIKELQDQLNLERHKGVKLEDSITKAEDSLSRKVSEYDRQIKELREQIMHYRLHPTPSIDTINKHVDEAEKLHQRVLFAINDFKKQIDQQLKDQEKDTIKRFDLKLARICNEIEDRKKKRIMELSSMANTEKKIAKDLESLRESAILVEQKNKHLEDQNKKLEQMIASKDSEFQSLMQEFYYTKRKLQPPKSENIPEDRYISTPKYSVTSCDTSEDKTDRYESVISKLRKQLETERKNLRTVRNAFAQEMEERTEMENIVRRLVEEIREAQAARGRGGSGEERAILIDKLLTSLEVASLLNRSPYEATSQDAL